MTRWGIAAGWVGLAGIVGSAGAASPSRAHFPVSATIVAHCSASTPDIVARGVATANAAYVSVDCGRTIAASSTTGGTAVAASTALTAPSRIVVDESDSVLRVTIEF